MAVIVRDPNRAIEKDIFDAINNLLTDGIATRDHITEETRKTISKLEEIESQLKIIIKHNEITTDEVITEDDVE